MSTLRSKLFLFSFYAWTGLLCLLALPATYFVSHKQMTALVHFWARQLAWLERHVAGINYIVKGRENIPNTPCIIAAKHQSMWETCKLYLIIGDPSVVLKEEITRVPIVKRYATATGMIPIDRGGRVKTLTLMMAAARKAVAAGRHIVIFPQGTRLQPGEKKPYKSGVAALYKEMQIPIVPMALNSGLCWPKKGNVKPGLITVEFLPPIPPGLSRQEMMERLAQTLDSASDRLAGLNT